VRAAALCWWAEDRTAQERNDLAQQLGSNFALSTTLNVNHRQIIEAESVWNELKDRLVVDGLAIEALAIEESVPA